MKRHFKTVHDNQQKVCFKCCSDQHLARNCPLIKCYSCYEFGHSSMFCPQNHCSSEKHREKCICKQRSIMSTDDDSISMEDGDPKTEGGDSKTWNVEQEQEIQTENSKQRITIVTETANESLEREIKEHMRIAERRWRPM